MTRAVLFVLFLCIFLFLWPSAFLFFREIRNERIACAGLDHPQAPGITFPKLPKHHRLASPEQCYGGGMDYALSTLKPKVQPEKANYFTTDGYKELMRGGGKVERNGAFAMYLSKLQHELGIFGSVGELGVHHGRFTGCLFITARKTEKLVIADLFEEQSKNIDNSGKGDREKFMKGLSVYGLDEKDVYSVFSGLSEEIPFDWSKRERFEQFRLFSVDACHTASCTFNDLEVAFCNTIRGGIVILDDFFTRTWMGVTEGFFQYATLNEDTVYPLLSCDGKLFLTNDRDHHRHYYEMLRNDERFDSFLDDSFPMNDARNDYVINGVKYLRCNSTAFSTEDRIKMWSSFVY